MDIFFPLHAYAYPLSNGSKKTVSISPFLHVKRIHESKHLLHLNLLKPPISNTNLHNTNRHQNSICPSSMAALSIKHSFHSKKSTIPHIKPSSKNQFSVSCQIREPIGSSDVKIKKKKTDKEERPWVLGVYGEVEKAGRRLKDSLSPKKKGDWQDLMLMSLSFAVYVYISQKLVCAYCAWMSMVKNF